MFEVIFGICIGIGYAMFFPGSLARLKKKVISITNSDHDCDENRRFRK